ncbi:hypothetical protein [Infirmifilum sp. SLHALR2]|nr:MAG: hypothetical protein B7L53_09600 [Thermofilum sp. NZ13]
MDLIDYAAAISITAVVAVAISDFVRGLGVRRALVEAVGVALGYMLGKAVASPGAVAAFAGVSAGLFSLPQAIARLQWLRGQAEAMLSNLAARAVVVSTLDTAFAVFAALGTGGPLAALAVFFLPVLRRVFQPLLIAENMVYSAMDLVTQMLVLTDYLLALAQLAAVLAPLLLLGAGACLATPRLRGLGVTLLIFGVALGYALPFAVNTAQLPQAPIAEAINATFVQVNVTAYDYHSQQLRGVLTLCGPSGAWTLPTPVVNATLLPGTYTLYPDNRTGCRPGLVVWWVRLTYADVPPAGWEANRSLLAWSVGNRTAVELHFLWDSGNSGIYRALWYAEGQPGYSQLAPSPLPDALGDGFELDIPPYNATKRVFEIRGCTVAQPAWQANGTLDVTQVENAKQSDVVSSGEWNRTFDAARRWITRNPWVYQVAQEGVTLVLENRTVTVRFPQLPPQNATAPPVKCWGYRFTNPGNHTVHLRFVVVNSAGITWPPEYYRYAMSNPLWAAYDRALEPLARAVSELVLKKGPLLLLYVQAGPSALVTPEGFKLAFYAVTGMDLDAIMSFWSVATKVRDIIVPALLLAGVSVVGVMWGWQIGLNLGIWSVVWGQISRIIGYNPRWNPSWVEGWRERLRAAYLRGGLLYAGLEGLRLAINAFLGHYSRWKANPLAGIAYTLRTSLETTRGLRASMGPVRSDAGGATTQRLREMQGARQLYSLERYLYRLERIAYLLDSPHRALVYYGVQKARELERLIGASREAQAILSQLPGSATVDKLLYYLKTLHLRPERVPTHGAAGVAYARLVLEKGQAAEAAVEARRYGHPDAATARRMFELLLRDRLEELGAPQWLKDLAGREPDTVLKVLVADRLSAILGGEFRLSSLRSEEEARSVAAKVWPLLWAEVDRDKFKLSRLAEAVEASERVRERRGEPTLSQVLGAQPGGERLEKPAVEEKRAELVAEVVKWAAIAEALGAGFNTILPVEAGWEYVFVPAPVNPRELRGLVERIESVLDAAAAKLGDVLRETEGLSFGKTSEEHVKQVVAIAKTGIEQLVDLREWAAKAGLPEDVIDEWIAALRAIQRAAKGVKLDKDILREIERRQGGGG